MSLRFFEDEELAKRYAKYRTSYPDDLKSLIMEYIKKVNPSCPYEAVLDVACGSGQATALWTDSFKNVYGSDISQSQISEAIKLHPTISFSVGSAEQLDFPDESMDLVTTACGLHYFDSTKFFAEVSRVLKQGGVLVAFTYTNTHNAFDKEEATALMQSEFIDVLAKGNYYTSRQSFVERQYKDYTFPLKNMERFTVEAKISDWTVEHVIGYRSTTSFYQTYIKANPGSTMLQDLYIKLKNLYKDANPVITVPIFGLIGQKPN